MWALRSLRAGGPFSFRVCVLCAYPVILGIHCKQWSIYQILADMYVEVRGHGNFWGQVCVW